MIKTGQRKVQRVPQSQTAALPRHQEEEETDKTKQARIEQPYEKHSDSLYQKYCDTAYARNGVNQMWILKNSKEFLENLKAPSLHFVNNIKSFDFSTLYTTIPHNKLKFKLKEIINQCFFHKNGNRRFQYVVIDYKDTYFVRDHSDAPQKYCRCHKDAGISNRQYFCGVRRTDISANNGHTDGY